MNNKWYTLTRPAVVQFNPPRDTQPRSLQIPDRWAYLVVLIQWDPSNLAAT